jgi:IS30 family transposase
MHYRKHLTNAQKQEIWTLFQNGLVSREISEVVGCTSATVCNWIRKLIPCNGRPESLSIEKPVPKSYCLPIHAKSRRKPLKPSHIHTTEDTGKHALEYGGSIEKRTKTKTIRPINEQLCQKMIELYQKFGSANRVAIELQNNGIYLSSPTILKEMRQYTLEKKEHTSNHKKGRED